MIDLNSLLSSDVGEDSDLEVKAAQGESGQGEVPRSVWETYSAMANTEGGTIILGAEEREDGGYEILGLKKPNKVRKEIFDAVNNRQVVSTNLLSDKNVEVIELEGKSLLSVEVPRAERAKRPVYAGLNPLMGTFRRNYEGDYKCDEDTVRRMLAEAVEPDRDSVLLDRFGMHDLSADTLAAYRNDFKSTNPNHPFLVLDDIELLRSLGGWKRDRLTSKEGLTVAGLLMFGKLRSILDALPNYVVDYQERPKPPSDQRWLDRVTTDGMWSGNLYDFYRKVLPKLTSDLKVPFRTSSPGKRVDEDNVHEALREAFVNALIHADFSGRIPILIVKRPDVFGFRNPGNLRLPVQVVLAGGTSDCRNRSLQKMFQLVGAAEQAGSGFPKIHRAWREQHWRPPLLSDGVDPEHTVLRLTTVSLLPPEALDHLVSRFGSKLDGLSEVERLTLATAYIEGRVTHQRMKAMTPSHARDLTAMFRTMVDGDFLEPEGVGRGTCYYLPGSPATVDAIESRETLAEHSSEHSGNNTTNSSEHSADYSEHSETPEEIARHVKSAGRVPQTVMIATVLKMCSMEEMSLKKLAGMLGRSPDTMRVHYLNELVRTGELVMKHPNQPNHPSQAYRTKRT